MSGHVFISYSRVDRGYVDRLAAHLHEAGLPVWFDYLIETGEPFGLRIQQAIDGCVAVLVVLTPDAVASKWVRREISYADHKQKKLLPLLLNSCELPVEVAGLLWEDVGGERMPSSRFVSALRTLDATPSAVVEAPTAARTDAVVDRVLAVAQSFAPEVEVPSATARARAAVGDRVWAGSDWLRRPTSEDRDGRIVTFYSFRGGVGRTMALANVAWILAMNGMRVLVADWDLESPCLHMYFKSFVPARLLASAGGVMDLVRTFEDANRRSHPEERWYEQYAQVHRYVFSLAWSFPDGGTLDFLSAGRQDNDYATSVNAMDWDRFYDHLGGGPFFDALRADMKRTYDYTLIDSRTGLNNVASICTIHLPDVLVDCFTYSDAAINGAAEVARVVQHRYGNRNIRILPVPMRVEQAEKKKADAGRAVAMRRFAGLPSGMTDEERRAYWAAVQVPYRPRFAHEETLAVVDDRPGTPASLLAAYEFLAGYITGGEVTALPPLDDKVRAGIRTRLARRHTPAAQKVTLRYAPDDQVWAEWIGQLLESVGIQVYDPWAAGRSADVNESYAVHELTIISHCNVAALADEVLQDDGWADQPLAVYVADVRPLPGFPIESSVFMAGLDAQLAAERVLNLVDGHNPDANPRELTTRYPDDDPVVFHAPARNTRFVGREDDLLRLRAQFRSSGTGGLTPTPVVLQGMGGIGKTQVALEYAHRFRSAYDVVWWIVADPAMFIDGAISDLGASLGIPPQPTTPETARSVLQALFRGEPYRRWLLIFDNAEDVARVGQFLQFELRGYGHVVITSRDPQWSDLARVLPVEVFERRESIAHLSQRIPTIKADVANRVAELLGDLPIAVAAAGAWLADTGTDIADYLQHIEQHGLSDTSVEATWDLSLQRLQQRSPAAYRLLQLCSVLGSEIALDLIHSDELAAHLTAYDPTVAERVARARLVQQIYRLALLKLDPPGAQIQVHRLLQHVVRARMTEEQLAEAKHEVHLVLAARRPGGEVDDPESSRRFRTLWPHLAPSDAVSCTGEAVRQLLLDRVRYLWLRADMPEGRELVAQVERAWMQQLRETVEDSRDQRVLRRQILQLRFNLSNLLRDQARFEEARQLDETVLQEQRGLLGDDHPHALMTASSLAADMRALGRYPEALELDGHTYEAWAQTYGQEHPGSLAALASLASSYRLAGNFRAAQEHDTAVYDHRRTILGENHLATLAAASNLGRDLRDAGEYDRSVALLETVLRAFLTTEGPDFRGTLNAQANLAVSLRSAGRTADAGDLLDAAYQRLNDTLGPSGPDTLACRLSRSVNLLALGETQRAHSELTAVHRAYQDSLGIIHPNALICVSNLAIVARAARNNRLARKLAREAMDSFRQTLGSDHPHTLAATMNLAVCIAEADDPHQALELMRETAGRFSAVLGPDHPDTLCCAADLAMILNHVGQPGPDADETAMLERLAGRLGQVHPAVDALRERRFLHRIVEPHPF